MSAQLPVLTQLCPICHTNPPKYKCPRCAMRTCSMACSQTHKVRASCSGIRDPAKYIPKRDMKSSTVDMDFNFLKTVQSTRDKGLGHLDRLEKGESLTARRKVSIAKRRAGLSRAGDCGVQVRKMSKVMERAQRNMTSWDAK